MNPAQSYTDDERRHFLRYTRTAKWPMLQRFPIDEDGHLGLLAGMLATDPGTVRSMIHDMCDENRATAARMLADDHYRSAVTGLPFRPGDRVVAIGDSITADRLGWFELLAASVDPAAATLVNLGVSGDTTADVLERFDTLEAARPSHVLLMIGTNDARLHGRAHAYRMATVTETARNLASLIDLITHQLGAAITVITPPAVDQDRIDAHFATAPVGWTAEAVAEIAGVIRTIAPHAIDLHEATRCHAPPGFLEADGVHPTPTGHQLILRQILRRLGRC
ncbi:SGNH/GDSL hydrolase family protein [Catenuloplanes indicus]|uniref:Lysophospholipase L1-like esterase n=1 Tax=Catenuloplanes indicus TaxID=137267 RepID=A0AAE3VWZ2_9ACTN|nr:GDSL-type esterase/lipase family protein [Catenuloplanes indicus]MDQ0365225.1 lysophospholipase L1-like esterase [Catenuloplanes indicus]